MNPDGSTTLAHNLSLEDVERLRQIRQNQGEEIDIFIRETIINDVADEIHRRREAGEPRRVPVAPIRIYRGRRRAKGNIVEVLVGENPPRPLDPRCDLNPDPLAALEWGYNGPGSAQLALAILADAVGGCRIALAWHKDFQGTWVAHFPFGEWEITSSQIHGWLVAETIAELEGKRAPRRRPRMARNSS